MFELAQKALGYTTKAGANEAEIYCISGRSVTIDVQKDEIDLAKESLISGIGIRAIVKGAVGFSSTNDPSRVEEACILAVKSARVRKGDPEWSGLPGKKEHPAVRDILDRKLVNIDIESCIEYTAQLIEGSKSVPSVSPTSGNFMSLNSRTLILNSNGVEVEEEDTFVNASIDTATKGAEMSTGSEFDASRMLDIDFYKIGKDAALLASRSQNGVSAGTGDMTVLLEPLAFSDILENTFLTSLNADNVQKGRSALTGKMGSMIAHENLSLIDDGTLSGGIGTASTDDEGTPSGINELVKNGTLNSFIYDCYTAGKEKRESTSNAVRGSFTSTPSISVRNLIVDYPKSDILGETRNGVIVNSVIGAHTANPISGDFSVEARNSFLIKDGEVASPIKSMMISGNIFELLKNIDGAGKDIRRMGNVITPTLRVSKLKVIG
ncbi:MAG: TldD/PmbA family protein [Euryarchaeota archaeon]|nr:TldD/PmbA family protein [Euryarchaeota archaeon]MBU4222191.1 TldD/PmbA family protein [Euryarchaeota archaeon]MBU4339608.1 TldD/PmbA family protein [Euryarchaeota archaeon]MBU4454713.1 TldD/PmbA family protein [Euryarchaeota archaeon]MCG2735484.1 TldD/PmbA family protein [Candidatus Methanoperedenaceae archaeon]